MSDLSAFMKKNKVMKENTFFAATKSLVDENGKPLLWEIQALTTKQDEAIRDACTKEVPVSGKRNLFRQKVDGNLYMVKRMVACIVSPNLYDAELQDSYGVKTPEDLLKELVDDPNEFGELATFITEYSGFDVTLEDEIEEAKN